MCVCVCEGEREGVCVFVNDFNAPEAIQLSKDSLRDVLCVHIAQKLLPVSFEDSCHNMQKP